MWTQHAATLILILEPMMWRLSTETRDTSSLEDAASGRLYQFWTQLDDLTLVRYITFLVYGTFGYIVLIRCNILTKCVGRIVPPRRNISLAFVDKNHRSNHILIEDFESSFETLLLCMCLSS